jgi:hypothetical protein
MEMKLDGYLGNDMKQYTKVYGVEEDARKLGCRNWLADALNRGRCRHLLEEADAHPGL